MKATVHLSTYVSCQRAAFISCPHSCRHGPWVEKEVQYSHRFERLGKKRRGNWERNHYPQSARGQQCKAQLDARPPSPAIRVWCDACSALCRASFPYNATGPGLDTIAIVWQRALYSKQPANLPYSCEAAESAHALAPHLAPRDNSRPVPRRNSCHTSTEFGPRDDIGVQSVRKGGTL